MQVASLVNVIKKVNSQESQWNNVIRPVLEELSKRLSFLVDVGVGYLTLNRRADTLSGGESQRIHLATQIGSKLSGVLYVLDEPTIGLHPRDTDRLLRTIKSIKDLGNSIIVVEHDREVMLAADHIIELGPAAGEMGGNIVFEGSTEDIQNSNCLSALYLREKAPASCFHHITAGGSRRVYKDIWCRGKQSKIHRCDDTARRTGLHKRRIGIGQKYFALRDNIQGH